MPDVQDDDLIVSERVEDQIRIAAHWQNAHGRPLLQSAPTSGKVGNQLDRFADRMLD
jgi:hypothetical protein